MFLRELEEPVVEYRLCPIAAVPFSSVDNKFGSSKTSETNPSPL
jgi:hypothetical protein